MTRSVNDNMMTRSH